MLYLGTDKSLEKTYQQGRGFFSHPNTCTSVTKKAKTMVGRNGKKKKKIKGQNQPTLQSQDFPQLIQNPLSRHIFTCYALDEEFRFLSLNSVKECTYSWQILGQIKLSVPTFLIIMKKTTSQTLQMFSFSKLLCCLATNYYQSLSFTCLMPGDVAFYFWVSSLFEAAWTSRGLSPTASPLRKKNCAQKFN